MNSQMLNEKTKILQWVIKWLKHPADSSNNSNIEVTDLASLLQCLGFTLNSFEKSLETTSPDIIDTNALKIEITCLESGMRAKMSKYLAKCQCPSKEEAHNAQIWNVSGQGPANTDKVNISNSSILPNVSPSKNRVIGDLLQKILHILNDNSKESNEPDIIRQKSLDSVKTDLSKNLSNSTWEVDPNTSPPKLTSSPIPELSNSLKQLSMKSEDDKTERLGELLRTVIKTAEEALEIAIGTNSTFTKNVVKKRVSDIKVSPLAEKSTNFVNMNVTKSKDSLKVAQSPMKISTPRKSIGGSSLDRRKMLPPPSLSTRTKTVGSNSISKIGTPPTSKAISSIRGDTPRPLGKSGLAKPRATTLTTTPTGENAPVGVSRLRTPSRIGSLTRNIATKK